MARVSLSWALILGLLSGIGPLCTDFYLPALPEITQQLQATSTQTQLSLTAALIGLGLGQLFFGPLSDRIGRLKPLALSLLLFIFSSAMCALTRDINMLIVWRFLQGFAGAGGSVLSRSIASDKYQGTLLTQFFALLMTVNGIAPVLSPVLGGYVITAFDWRILFWTMAAIGGVLLVMSLAILRETRPAGAEKSPLSALLPDSGLYDGRAVLLHRLFFLRDAERIRHERHAVQSAVRSERYRADHRRDDLFPSGAPL
ncbi:membrane transport protein [Klebsiella pneumoniae]|uniref:Membrane transport protein n=1 Tax=Klebsiella pneumoniae TaxID=573 RepID=A0A2X3F5Q0_KLEPN|nr:membrane transport protein [Klebsiella pneumoniae]